jgi:putative intracellular protease/amidase
MVLTSHDKLGETGRGTGFYLSEAAHPWQAFASSGYQVDLVSPRGGTPPMDGADLTDAVQKAFMDDGEMAVKLASTSRPADIDPDAYDAIFYAGGHGTMWDFPDDDRLAGISRAIYQSGGVVSAVCHGPAGLINVTLPDGRPLVQGMNVTGFSNDEEEAAGLTEVVPFALEDALIEHGGRYTSAANFEPHVVVDGRLVTGQNPASAAGTAKAVLEVLASR